MEHDGIDYDAEGYCLVLSSLIAGIPKVALPTCCRASDPKSYEAATRCMRIYEYMCTKYVTATTATTTATTATTTATTATTSYLKGFHP